MALTVMKSKKKKKKENYFFPLFLCIISLAHDGLPQRSGQGCCLKVTLKGEKRAVSAPSIFERDYGHLDPKEKKVLEPLRRG